MLIQLCFYANRHDSPPPDVMGLSGTFFTYGVIAVAAVIFIYLLLPETKGKALQDIDRELCERRSDQK